MRRTRKQLKADNDFQHGRVRNLLADKHALYQENGIQEARIAQLEAIVDQRENWITPNDLGDIVEIVLGELVGQLLGVHLDSLLSRIPGDAVARSSTTLTSADINKALKVAQGNVQARR